MKEQNNFAKENQEIVEIQEKINKISKAKSRQLGRLIEQLKKINTSQIVIDGCEKYFNFYHLDTMDIIKEIQEIYDKSKQN
jgi:archaellum biogenesis ATPase FlaH